MRKLLFFVVWFFVFLAVISFILGIFIDLQYGHTDNPYPEAEVNIALNKAIWYAFLFSFIGTIAGWLPGTKAAKPQDAEDEEE